MKGHSTISTVGRGRRRHPTRLALGAIVLLGLLDGSRAGAGEAAPAATITVPELPPPPSNYSSSRRDNFEFEPRHEISSGGFEVLRPQKIYFPPNPPPLGVEIMPGADANERRALAPAELAPFVLELFYAPLSTRFGERTLNRRHEEFLVEHTTRKTSLLEELRIRLAGLANADPARRLQELEALAVRQTPLLADMEKKADEFRQGLYTSGLLSDGSGDWYAMRTWKLGRGTLDQPREANRFLEYQVIRAAAFYQDGLIPDQRRLLREIAMEMEDTIFGRHDGVAPSASDWFSFFSPHLARLHWPEELPAHIAAQVRRHREEKDALKRELRDAIYEYDKVMFAGARNRAMADLAEKQRARLLALETLAESIRRELVRHPTLVPQAVPPLLPPDMAARIEHYQREKRALQQELSNRVRAVTRTLPPPDPSASPEAVRDWNAKRADAINRETIAFEQDNAERLRALDQKLEVIRADIEVIAGPAATVGIGSGFDAFLTDFLAERRQQNSARDYHLAVLEPGLSPEQRRLLFDAAVVALNLPLPGPETQATSVPGTMLK